MVFGIDFLAPVSSAKLRVKLLNEIGSGSYAKVYQAIRVEETSTSDEPTYYAAKVINLRKAPKDFTSKFLPRELDLCSKVSMDTNTTSK